MKLPCGGSNGASSAVAPTTTPTARAIVTLVDVKAVVDVTAGGPGTWNWVGQSVTMPAGGPFDNIRFNWYTSRFIGLSPSSPTAFGTLYLLKQEYLGLPGDLSPSTPGFVARSASISEGQYLFAPGVTLTSGTQYWFYTDTQGDFASSFDVSTYPDGDMYVTGYPTLAFRKAQASWRYTPNGYIIPPPGTFQDANFRLQGSAVATQ